MEHIFKKAQASLKKNIIFFTSNQKDTYQSEKTAKNSWLP